AQVSCEEEPVGTIASECGEEAQLRHVDILCLVHHGEVERSRLACSEIPCHYPKDHRGCEECSRLKSLASAREDLPEHCALLLAESSLAPEAGDVAVALPGG